ncbi:DUF1800 family protein [Novosphingobium sp. Gsoil 351]|nr:DUF1800 family protein [Novosphingobium sp. Gsoil 351]
MNRFGLGARDDEAPPSDPHRWLTDQLARFAIRPAPIAALPGTPALVALLADLREARQERRAATATPEPAMNGELRTATAMPGAGLGRGLRQAYLAAVGARTNVALVSETPFVERLVHFWANHFAVSVDKQVSIGLAGALEFEAIRPHVLGSFADLLGAVERHPAMLLYLDQAQSIGPDSPLGQRAARNGRQRGLNENLAREIMELHTLGVRTVYTQADVTEFARALTGWTVGGLGRLPFLRGTQGGFLYAPPLHEPGARAIMGKRYGEDGEEQAQAVLADLAAHPATARHIATKLARHFSADDPPPTLVARLEQAFLTSRGDLPTVYRALVAAPEGWDETAAKFRTPWDWGIAAMRAAGVRHLEDRAAAGAFVQLGQAVWKPGSPAGWDDIAASWAGPDALVRRVELADRIAGRVTTPADPRALAEKLFPGALAETTRTAIQRAESPAQGLALLLASPEMMRR